MTLWPAGSHLAPDLLALRPGVPEFFGLDLDRFDGAVDSQFFGAVVEPCDFCCPSRCKKAFSSRKGDRSWAKTQPNAFGAPRKLYGRGAADDITL